MQYTYPGPGPQEDGDGGVVRPGDTRDFDQAPDWGPWEPSGGAESDPPAPAAPAPAPAPDKPAPAASAPPVTASATPPKEM